VCAHTNFLRWSGFICGCSASCWSICVIDLMRELEGGRWGYGWWVFRRVSKIAIFDTLLKTHPLELMLVHATKFC